MEDFWHQFFTVGLVYSIGLSTYLTIRAAFQWVSRPGGDPPPLVSADSAEACGERGERRVEDALRQAGIPTLRNVFLHQPGGRLTEIDLLALVGSTILVIEVKAWSGQVVGDVGDETWFQRKDRGGDKLMKNPLRQNHHHLRALRRALPSARSASIVVFTDAAFPAGTPAGVVDIPGLLRRIADLRRGDPDAATIQGWGKLSAWSMQQDKSALQANLVRQIGDRLASPLMEACGSITAPNTTRIP